MRTLLKVSIMLMLVAGIFSCEKIKSIFDVEIDTTLSGNLDIDIQESAKKSAAGYDFESSATINPLDDEDIAEYTDKIKEFQVNGVEVEVIYVNKGDVVFESGTAFYISDMSNTITWTLSGDWDVMEGTTLSLEDMGDVYQAVADILDKKETFTVGAVGTCSQTDVYITLKMGIDTKVIANPL